MIIMCCYTQMNAVIVKTWYLVVLAIICIMAVLESKPEKHERCLRLVQIGCALFVMDCFYLQQRSCALPDYGMHLSDFWQSSAMYLWGTAVFYTCFRIESHVGDDELTGKAGSTLPLQHQRTTPTPLTRLLKKPTQTTSQQPATTSSYKKPTRSDASRPAAMRYTVEQLWFRYQDTADEFRYSDEPDRPKDK